MKRSNKLQDAIWRAQCGLVEPEGEAEDWTEEGTKQYYKRLQHVEDLVQTAQDEVWELVEKVLKKTNTHPVFWAGTCYLYTTWEDCMGKGRTLKEAIIEANKELEK